MCHYPVQELLRKTNNFICDKFTVYTVLFFLLNKTSIFYRLFDSLQLGSSALCTRLHPGTFPVNEILMSNLWFHTFRFVSFAFSG